MELNAPASETCSTRKGLLSLWRRGGCRTETGATLVARLCLPCRRPRWRKNRQISASSASAARARSFPTRAAVDQLWQRAVWGAFTLCSAGSRGNGHYLPCQIAPRHRRRRLWSSMMAIGALESSTITASHRIRWKAGKVPPKHSAWKRVHACPREWPRSSPAELMVRHINSQPCPFSPQPRPQSGRPVFDDKRFIVY